MSYLFDFLFWSLSLFLYLFIAYVFTMAVYDKVKDKPVQVLLFKIFIAAPFLLFDAFVNVFVISPWFAEFPKEWLVTSRLKRWRKEFEHRSYNDLSGHEKRRLIFAVNICDKALDRYDKITGDHC